MVKLSMNSVLSSLFRKLGLVKAALLVAMFALPALTFAQRKTDNLDRGLVGVKVGSGVFLSWRVQADEYYDVTYNLYRNGSLIAQNLSASNYTDPSGSTSNTYTVAPVRKGVAGAQCAAVTPWDKQYLEIPVSNIQARSGVTVWKQSDPSTAMADYQINDISLGDVDGDGKIDLIVKRKNQTDQNDLFPESNKQMYCQIECYASSKNYARLWWIDCGPNICYGADEQWDAVAFDWNEDGACEVLYRGGANTVIHHADGTTETIGNVNENIRGGITHYANMTFSNDGEEWLMYIDGRTGKTYDVISYPIPRGKATDWGDGYGHRSSKYFMGAPYLDGVNPYIFLGRGIYTKVVACTYRVDKSKNKLYKVGNTWNSYNNAGWYGQGYHNFSIADVDLDGSDEIIYGSMVLDFHTGDNSLHGMASTGLGHGDASHTGDLDPFRKGLETFACNEDDPAYNYRNAATCEIYARYTAGGDDGRSMAANVTNEYPGCIGASTTSGIVPLSYVQPQPYSPTYIEGMANNWNGQTPYPMALNFRIYWDGDLLDETVNGPGSNDGYLYVDKLGRRIFDTGHGHYETTNINGTKKNPCALGDILGDWREELIVRSADNRFIRIYTTVTPTEYRMPSLWYDHEYRQAMVWQTEGYNQPPHTSYFVGELEGFTQAPPAYTWAGRTGIGNNGTISTSHNSKDVLIMPDGNGSEYKITMGENAQPSTVFLVSRTTIEGGDQVAYKETKHTFDRIRVTGAAFSGTTNIAKQGDAAAHLPYAKHTHSGKTDVWMGALICNGSLENSPLWANIHTELYVGNALDATASTYKSIEMEYGSQLFITNHSISTPLPTNNGYAHMNVGNLTVKEGSRVVFDINGKENATGDKLNITGKLTVRKQNWKYGPKYLAPVFEIRSASKLAKGEYLLGSFGELAVGSNMDDIIIECPNGADGKVTQIYAVEDKYYLHVGNEKFIVNQGKFIAGQTYYLYNDKTGKFLSRGGAYGYRAMVDDYGVPVIGAPAADDGTYRLKAAEFNALDRYNREYDTFFGMDGWMYADKNEGASVVFNINEVDGMPGYFTISRKDNSNLVFVNSASGADQYAVGNDGKIGTNCSAEDTYWRFLSADEHSDIISNNEADQLEAAFLSAGLSVNNLKQYNAKDRTDKITNASLRLNTDGWTLTANTGRTFSATVNNNVCEVYQGAGSFTQTVTGLEKGLYRVTVSGFYRQGKSATCVDLSDYNISTAYLQAGSSKVQLKDWASDMSGTNTPNNLAEAEAKFNDGKYVNTVYAAVGTDGKLTISVVQPSMTSYGWLALRDFKLELIEPMKAGDNITNMIANADFNTGKADGWTGGPTVNATAKDAEFFDKTFDLNQTINDLPKGWYEIGVQGFYRNGLTGGKASKALIYANNTSKYLRRIETQTAAECGLSTGKVPDNMAEANTVFEKGLYQNTLRVYVEDGSLTFGIKKVDAVSKDWAIFDNFTLKYLGETNDDNDRTQYIADNSFETASLQYWSSINTGTESKAAENSNATYTVDIADGNYVFNSWDKSGTYGVSQTIQALPKGVYMLTAVLASDANNQIEININDDKVYSFTMPGPKQKGIVAECNTIIVNSTSDVLINVKSNTWFKVDNIRLTFIGDVTEEVLIAETKKELQTAIDEAKAVVSVYPSGSRIFDYNTSSVNSVISSAEKVVGSSSVTRDQVNVQVNNMETLVRNVSEGHSNIAYNGPEANKRYNIMFSNKPVTFVDGDTPALGFSGTNANFIQAFILEAGETDYSYKLCFYTEAGKKMYLCTTNDATGSTGSDGNYTMSVTADASKALSFGVERSEGYSDDGVFYLRNPKLGNNYLHNLDGSFKTGLVGNGKGNFTIGVASKAEATLKISGSAEWGTFIAPFAVSIPADAKAYTVSSDLDDDYLILDEVIGTIPANTPVLVSNFTGSDIVSNVADYGTASTDEYQEGLLVGRYSNATLPVSDEYFKYYILQRQDGETSFCKLTSPRTATPYRCYLKLPIGVTANSRLRIGTGNSDDTLTSIDEAELDAHIVMEVYNAAGKRISALQNGINIVKFKDGSIRKVMIIK